MRILVTILALVVTLSCAKADAWQPAAAYAYAPIARCAELSTAALKPNEARYEICADQMALFTAALAKARAENKLLIVDFGATWCPWCRSLQAQWQSPALLGHTSSGVDFARTFDIIEIGISTVHAGRRRDVPSGHAVLAEVLAATAGTKQRSVPFLAVIDPNDRSKALARNLDDFEMESAGRHDASFIRAFLVGAHDHMRKGGAAPTTPGWLRAKFNRAWMKLFG